MENINKLQEITEKLNRSKLLKGIAYDVLNTFIEQQKKQLSLNGVVKSFICDAEEKGGSRCETQCLGCDGFQRDSEAN